MQTSPPQTKVQVQKAQAQFNVSGTGGVTADIDTGVDPNHPVARGSPPSGLRLHPKPIRWLRADGFYRPNASVLPDDLLARPSSINPVRPFWTSPPQPFSTKTPNMRRSGPRHDGDGRHPPSGSERKIAPAKKRFIPMAQVICPTSSTRSITPCRTSRRRTSST